MMKKRKEKKDNKRKTKKKKKKKQQHILRSLYKYDINFFTHITRRNKCLHYSYELTFVYTSVYEQVSKPVSFLGLMK